MSPGGQSNWLLIRRLLHPSTPDFAPIRGRFFAQVFEYGPHQAQYALRASISRLETERILSKGANRVKAFAAIAFVGKRAHASRLLTHRRRFSLHVSLSESFERGGVDGLRTG
jgi:hypothetical protein